LTVKVAAGTAFDSQGRQIILLYEKAVNLVEANNKNPISDGEYTLSIRYSEELTDKQGDDDFTTTRVQEKPEFVLSSSSAKPDDTILLAKLTIKGQNVTIDQKVREYSGIYLPTEEGKGVTLRAQVGVPNQAMLEGSLSISGELTVLGGSDIKGRLKVQGDLHIVQSLQIGDANESQSVNRIVNEIREGTKDKADEKALITVKAAVDLAETKANKNGNSKEDFTAAHLRVNTLTINQKDVTAICDEINEEEEKENETAIPTIAALIKYMESREQTPVVTGLQMTYTNSKGEGEKIVVTWPAKWKKIDEKIPILLRGRIKIITTSKDPSELTLSSCESVEKYKLEIKKEKDGWECTSNMNAPVYGAGMAWSEKLKETIGNAVAKYWRMSEEEKRWLTIATDVRLLEKVEREARVTYDNKTGWQIARQYTIIDAIIEQLQVEDDEKTREKGKVRTKIVKQNEWIIDEQQGNIAINIMCNIIRLDDNTMYEENRYIYWENDKHLFEEARKEYERRTEMKEEYVCPCQQVWLGRIKG
jgi:hypothetical protein